MISNGFTDIKIGKRKIEKSMCVPFRDNISEIAEATGRDWITVAKYIDMADFNPAFP